MLKNYSMHSPVQSGGRYSLDKYHTHVNVEIIGKGSIIYTECYNYNGGLLICGINLRPGPETLPADMEKIFELRIIGSKDA